MAVGGSEVEDVSPEGYEPLLESVSNAHRGVPNTHSSERAKARLAVLKAFHIVLNICVQLYAGGQGRHVLR